MVLLANCFVVHFHVVVDSFFIAQMIVVLHLTVIEYVVGSWILLFLVIFVISLLGSSTKYSAIFCCAAMSSCRVLFFKLDFWACIAKRCRSKLTFFRCGYEVLLWWCALLVSSLGAQLAVNWTTTCRLGTPFLISFFLLLLLNFFPRLEASEDLVGLPLGPYKIVILPVIIIAHTPPKSRL